MNEYIYVILFWYFFIALRTAYWLFISLSWSTYYGLDNYSISKLSFFIEVSASIIGCIFYIIFRIYYNITDLSKYHIHA